MSKIWSPATRYFIAVIGLVLGGALLYAMKPMLGPLLIAGILAYMLQSPVVWLKRRFKIGHRAAVSLVFTLFLLGLIALPGTMVPILIGQAESLSENFLQIEAQLTDFLSQPLLVLGREIPVDQMWSEFLAVTTELGPAAVGALTVLETTSLSLAMFLVVIVTVFYMLLDWDGMFKWVLRQTPPSSRDDIRRLLADTDGIWRAYIQGTLMLMLIMGIFFVIVGLALGLPGALLLGIITGLLSMIPEFGPIVGGLLSVLVALVQGSSYLNISNLWFALLIGTIYVIAMQIKSIWLRPQVMGRFLHMNTGLVFVAIVAALLTSGILGALVVLPVMATVSVFAQYARKKMLGMDPWSEEPVAVDDERQEQIEPEAADAAS